MGCGWLGPQRRSRSRRRVVLRRRRRPRHLLTAKAGDDPRLGSLARMPQRLGHQIDRRVRLLQRRNVVVALRLNQRRFVLPLRQQRLDPRRLGVGHQRERVRPMQDRHRRHALDGLEFPAIHQGLEPFAQFLRQKLRLLRRDVQHRRHRLSAFGIVRALELRLDLLR